MEALQKWRHFLLGNVFQLISDQQALSHMHDSNKLGNIKNKKNESKHIELSDFKFDIIHRPVKVICVSDTLTMWKSLILIFGAY